MGLFSNPVSGDFLYTGTPVSGDGKKQRNERLTLQAMTALAETTAIADFSGLTVFSAIDVVTCITSQLRKTKLPNGGF